MWLNPCCFWVELPQCSLRPLFEALLSLTDLFGSLCQSGCNVLWHVSGFFWPSAELVGAQPLAACVTAASLLFVLIHRAACFYLSVSVCLCCFLPLPLSTPLWLHPALREVEEESQAHIWGCQNVWYSKCALLQKYLFFWVSVGYGTTAGLLKVHPWLLYSLKKGGSMGGSNFLNIFCYGVLSFIYIFLCLSKVELL